LSFHLGLNVLFNSLIADSEDNLQRAVLALQNTRKILEWTHHQVIDFDTTVVCKLLGSLGLWKCITWYTSERAYWVCIPLVLF